MQQSQQLVSMSQSPYPGVPCSIHQTISKACKRKNGNDGRIRWVGGNDDVCDDFARRCEKSNSTAAKEKVQAVTEKRSYRVTGERREKDQRSDGVREMIVGFNLEGNQ